MNCTQEMHCIICDGCQKIFTNPEGEAFFRTQKEAEEAATTPDFVNDSEGNPEDISWTKVKDKHFCPDCDEKADAYDDELRAKGIDPDAEDETPECEDKPENTVAIAKKTSTHGRKLASVVVIDKISPIEGADKIVVATMVGKGWKVVVQKDEFHEGDLAVFFEIDSFLNPDDERYAFLRDRCLRKFVSKSGTVLRQGIKIKSIKLRGVVSQGLLLPLAQFVGPDKEIQSVDEPATPENCVADDGKPLTEEELKGMTVSTLRYVKDWAYDENGNRVSVDAEFVTVENGTDLTELLKVEHYDEVKEQMTPICGGGAISADAMGNFPSDYAPKTDEERIQNLGDWITKYADRKFEVTCKDDGSSCSMFYSPTIDAENPFGVCSRNLRQKPVTAKGMVPAMWLVAKKYLVEEKLKALYEKDGSEWMVQGEFVAPGVQGNRDKYVEPEWHVFRIWDIKNQRYVDPKTRRDFCKANGIPHVSVIAEEMPVFQVYHSIDEILKFAEGKTARGNEREGLVFKTSDCLDPQLSFKAVSNRYLLKQED